MTQPTTAAQIESSTTGLRQCLGLFDSTMLVAGSMIGAGIFIVAADMARTVGSVGWLLVSWVITGLLTVAAALSYGELAGMMPRAGGQYVYLSEAWSPFLGFLYGWTLFLVIQTGTIAAVGVGFARYLGILMPGVSESSYIIPPIHILRGYALSLSSAQLGGVLLIAVLTWANVLGINYGKAIQNIFTSAKLAALFGVIVLGLIAWIVSSHSNFSDAWTPRGYTPVAPGLGPNTLFGLVAALCVAQVGSLFSADGWNGITFTAGEVKNPGRNVPLSLALGTLIVTLLYTGANFAYAAVLGIEKIQHAPSDRVAGSMIAVLFPSAGAAILAVVIIISAIGCVNGLSLTGARAYFAMARDGLFFRRAGVVNRSHVPGAALAMQGAWACFLVLVRTYNPATGAYGNLYSNLLDYVVSADLLFYIFTIGAVMRLRHTRPNAARPARAWGYPWVPVFYILSAVVILTILFLYRPSTTFPGLVIVAIGVPVYFAFRRFSSQSASKRSALP